MSVPRVLILGGTAEAAALAEALAQAFGDRLDTITSLAGKTAVPRAVPAVGGPCRPGPSAMATG